MYRERPFVSLTFPSPLAKPRLCLLFRATDEDEGKSQGLKQMP
jgi:hypothetical protein